MNSPPGSGPRAPNSNAKVAATRGPLHGQRVVVTRPPHQAAELSSLLRAAGARPVEAATIRIADPPDRGPLLHALRSLESYDWVVFTSVNGVGRVRDALEELGLRTASLAGRRLAAIGPATGAALEALGLRTEVIPESYQAEALARAIERSVPSGALAGRRVLLPRAAEARPVLPDRLRAAGAEVDEVPAYVTLPAEREVELLRQLVHGGEADWITFTSSSTVRNYVRSVGARTGGARVAVIGPITAATARELGVRVDVVAEEYTIPGLVSALLRATSGAE